MVRSVRPRIWLSESGGSFPDTFSLHERILRENYMKKKNWYKITVYTDDVEDLTHRDAVLSLRVVDVSGVDDVLALMIDF